MILRVKTIIRGAVQGVGFRPFVYRLASEMNLKGFVLNSSNGVIIEAEGEKNILDEFLLRLEKEKPQLAIINSLEFSFLDPVYYSEFSIRKSSKEEEISALILPDIAVCTDCLNEMLNPNDRRYLYPFINCTNCGPRFTIIESLPYDRPRTSMKNFKMCKQCEEEYHNPLDRRFHAQPIACPQCGPQIELWDRKGSVLLIQNDALEKTIELIKNGQIVAIKGLGGFHLVVDARNNQAVLELRKRKHREEKPFALMFPSLDLVKEICFVDFFEERLLRSPESPIVLLKKKELSKNFISDLVAPGNPYLGIMLPYTPLHHLLMRGLGFPIVATSGNLSEEPICIDENEALKRLNNIADFFLVHNRPILRHADDSIARIIKGREFILRRARGYAPLPIQIENLNDDDILAVGGHLKNTIALKKKNLIFVSQHIGDLSTGESLHAFKKTIEDFRELYLSKSDCGVGDLHPNYISTKIGKEIFQNFWQVQHHLAHVISCKLENQVTGEFLGISWDGTGYGFDGTIWGSEFFLVDDKSFQHLGNFRKFALPTGEKAIQQPKRTLVGILYEIFGEDILKLDFVQEKFDENELKMLITLIEKKINSPLCVSAGRLFDGVSSLIGLGDRSNFEGQAAMKLEFCVDWEEKNYYPFSIDEINNKLVVNWEGIIKSIIDEKNKVDKGIISARFHNTLSQIILHIAKKFEIRKIVLSGGCFQNKYLLEKTIELLEENHFTVYWHQRIPTNDGGISVGQIGAINLKNRSI